MDTLKSRLIFSHILPLLIVIPLIGAALIYLLETELLLNRLAQTLSDQGALIAVSINDHPEILGDTAEAQDYLTDAALSISSQLFLLRPDGHLLASSEPSTIAPPALPTTLGTWRGGAPLVLLDQRWPNGRAEVFVPITGEGQQLIAVIALRDTLQSVTSGVGRLRQLVLPLLLTELLLAALLGYWLAVRLERPIHHAATSVVEIAGGRDPGPLPLEGPQEIRQLSQSVNILADRLRRLESSRRHSLANIVHELGRPLGAIKAAIHVLRQGAGDDPAIRQELLAGIDSHLEQMEPLLDDLTLLHSQVSGQRALQPQPTPMSDWLATTLQPWQAAALAKNLRWDAAIPADLPTLNIDPLRMAQVLGNLLDNAIKYTPAGGELQVTAAIQENPVADQRELAIQISDNGPGILPQEQEQVFEPFYRGQQQQRFPKGLGLGLAIARDLVQAHNGRLTLDSTTGQGSSFTIHLPINSLIA